MFEIRLLFGRPRTSSKEIFISRIRELQVGSGCTIQALDADLVASERHLAFAAEKALSAFIEGRSIAKDLGIEIMRYASGQRQIERAMSMGLSGSTNRVALAIVRRNMELQPLGRDQWPNSSELSELIVVDGLGCSSDIDKLRKAFDISDEELQAAGEDKIADLVLERVALVDTYR